MLSTKLILAAGALAISVAAAVPSYPTAPPKCRYPADRCAGAPGKPAIDWIPCCQGGCDTPHPDWGMMCTPYVGPIRYVDGKPVWNYRPQVEEKPKCRSPQERCAGASGKPRVDWIPCCDGGCDTPHPDWGRMCTPSYVTPVTTSAPVVYDATTPKVYTTTTKPYDTTIPDFGIGTLKVYTTTVKPYDTTTPKVYTTKPYTTIPYEPVCIATGEACGTGYESDCCKCHTCEEDGNGYTECVPNF